MISAFSLIHIILSELFLYFVSISKISTMKNDNLLDALIKVNKAPKSILDVEFQYKGCIFTDACNIIEHFGDTSNSSQENLSTEYLTNALGSLIIGVEAY